MPKITLTNEKKEIEVEAGANLRQAALKAGVDIYQPLDSYLNCRGLGMCGTCKVLVKSGMDKLTPKTFVEKLTLLRSFSVIGHEDEMRLACQVRVNGDCTLETKPPMNISGEVFWAKPFPNK